MRSARATTQRPRSARPAFPLRFLTLLLAPALLASVVAAPVAAWANGKDGNGYGTHDWMLDYAYRLVQEDASWFDWETARLATDDPDYIEVAEDPSRAGEHTFREAGAHGGAIHRITEHYANAVHLYEAGAAAAEAGDSTLAASKFKAASKQIGLLSHFWTDILQPWHSAQAGVGKDGSHSAYEHLVDDRTDNDLSDNYTSWDCSSGSEYCTTRTLITNVRTSAVAAAAYSRAKFPTLYSSFTANTSTLNSTVRDITGKLMRRGIRDLADVIWSIKRGSGIAPAVGSISVRVKWRGTKYGETLQREYATAKDVNGDPMPGLQIDFDWPDSSGGTTPLRVWVGPTGVERSIYVPATKFAKMVKQPVVASATTDGVTVSSETWTYVTPKLASSTTGFRTKVNDTTVKAGQTVTVSTYAKDTSGNPVKGLYITWTFDYNGTLVKQYGYTDSNGKAVTTRLIQSGTTRTQIHVQASTSAYSINRYSNAYFKRTD